MPSIIIKRKFWALCHPAWTSNIIESRHALNYSRGCQFFRLILLILKLYKARWRIRKNIFQFWLSTNKDVTCPIFGSTICLCSTVGAWNLNARIQYKTDNRAFLKVCFSIVKKKKMKAILLVFLILWTICVLSCALSFSGLELDNLIFFIKWSVVRRLVFLIPDPS